MDIQPDIFICVHVLVSIFVVSVVVHPSATTLRLCPSPGNLRTGDKHTSFSSAALGTQL
jgi:hypothetical protein